MSSSSECAAYLSGIKEQSEELYGIIRDEQKQQISRWTDEQVCLESFVLALSSTRDLLKQEKLRIHADLSTLKTNYEKQAALFQKGVDRQDIRTEELEVVDLQKQLIELNNRILDVNFELERLDEQLQGLMRPDERPLFETKLLVLTVR
jgi:predicted hydrolase (HD superfamily)